MTGRPWPAHPYHSGNNIQDFNGNLNADTSPDLSDPRVREHHAAYIRKVVDTVNDLDNVLYEVMNEGGNKDWHWWIVNTVQAYENSSEVCACRIVHQRPGESALAGATIMSLSQNRIRGWLAVGRRPPPDVTYWGLAALDPSHPIR